MTASDSNAKSFSELTAIACELTYHIDGIGDVTFPDGVNVTPAVASVEISNDLSPKDLVLSQAASQAAIEAIKEYYPTEIADKIISNLSSFLDPLSTNLKLPVNVIRSKDFFQERLTVIPKIESLLASLESKVKDEILSEIQKNPLFPAASVQQPLSEQSSISVEQIKGALIANGITASSILSLSNKTDLVNAVKNAGIFVTVPTDLTSQIKTLLDETQSYADYSKKDASNVYSCPPGKEIPPTFTPDEVIKVAQQCCTPVPDAAPQIPNPTVNLPETATVDQVNAFIDLVNAAAQEMSKCSAQRADAELYIQKIRKIKEDLYTFSYYVSERYKAIQTYQTILQEESSLAKIFDDNKQLITSIIAEADKTFSTKVVKNKINKALSGKDIQDPNDRLLLLYNALYSLGQANNDISTSVTRKKQYLSAIQSYSDKYTKSLSTVASLQANIKALQGGVLSTSSPADENLVQSIVDNPIYISNYLLANTLVPMGGTGTISYSNQCGRINNGDYFLLIQEEGAIFDEIQALFQMNLSTVHLENFLQPASNPNKNLVQYAKNPRGVLYEKFYEQYNSVDRVDFLFTSQEQGYLSPKPSASELTTTSGKEKIANLQIDETVATNFQTNYATLEEARVLQKLSDLKTQDSSFFSKVKLQAQTDAAAVYQAESELYALGDLPKAKIIQEYRQELENEYNTISSFEEQLDNKVASLRKISIQSLQCIADQEAKLSSMMSSDSGAVPPPCSDPFGSNPTSPDSPSIYKKCYWDQFTSCLQSVSYLPIPDFQELNKRLFRYYPVGFQIPVPSPPGILPTLASGIPDRQISIPFPVIWKNVANITTPAGTLVLWITYCAPFMIAPYLMYFDQEEKFVFLTTPRGPVDLPAHSLGWDDDSILSQSLFDRIPGLKIPMSALPQIDNVTNNKKPDDSKSALQELRARIKASIDNLQSDDTTFSEERIRKRTKIRTYTQRIKKSLNLVNGQIDKEAVNEFLQEIKQMVKDDVDQMIDFEPFTVPQTQSKLGYDKPAPLVNFNDTLSKIKSLAKNGVIVENKSIDVAKILRQKASGVLDTTEGRDAIDSLQEDLNYLNSQLASLSSFSSLATKRSELILKGLKKILEKAISEITPETLGFIPMPTSLNLNFLPVPCKSNLPTLSMPPWMETVLASLNLAISTSMNDQKFKEDFARNFSSQINLSQGTLPSAKDLLYEAMSTGVNLLLNSVPGASLVPGWPNAVQYPTLSSLLSQSLWDLENSLWEISFNLSLPGIPPLKVTPQVIKPVVDSFINVAVEVVFATISNELLNVIVEPKDPASINRTRQALNTIRTIFGNDIWDLNEQDLKVLATAFAIDSLKEVDNFLKTFVAPLDSDVVEFKNFFSQIAAFSKQKSSKKSDKGPTLDLGPEVAKALYYKYIDKYVSGKIPPTPYPLALLACSYGVSGWETLTTLQPFSAIEKLPPYERLCLQNIPFTIFLDLVAATAQRMGGIGSDYVAPYFTPQI